MTLLQDLTPAATSTQIQSKLTELQTWLATQLPDVDVTDPVLISVVLSPWVKLLVENENTLSASEKLARVSSNNLSAIDSSLHDQVRQFIADIHGVSQSLATAASGELKIITSSQQTIILGAGTQFTTGSTVFATSQSYVLQSPAQPATTATRVFRPTGDGKFYTTVPVVAMAAGAAGNVAIGTAFNTVAAKPESIISVAAASNFIGGEDSNSLAWILEAIRQNAFSRSLGTRDQIVAWLTNNPLIGGVRQVGVIGFGDSELVRDFHPVLPLQRAGLTDLYLASSYYPAQHTITLEAVVTGSTTVSTLLKVDIGRTDSPGFLRIDKVVDVETGLECKLVAESRGLDLTPTYNQQLPVLVNPYHGGFSAFQTASLEIDLSKTGLLVGERRNVSVTILRVAGLDIAQSLLSSRNVRSLSGDVLARAAIPMLVNIRVQLQSQFETLTPDVSAMQSAIAQEFDVRPMRDRVTMSDIVRAILPFLPDDLTVNNVLFDAELILPSGVVRRITSSGSLDCPIDRDLQLSPRTVAMYCSPSNVQITQDRILTPSTP